MTVPKPPRRSAVTLASLAGRLGVHVSTVSRALSDNPVGVGTETVERVRLLASELGYRRNVAASALRTGESRMIGVMVPRLTDVTMATVYDGIDRAATVAGYNTVVVNTRDEPELQRSRLELMLSRQVDGFILADSRTDSNIVPELERAGVPFVLVMRRLPRQISVTTDDVKGGRLAGSHLFEHGHRRVAVVGGDLHASTGIERAEGLRRVYEEAGHPVDDKYVIASGFGVDEGRRDAEQVLALAEPPTAIFAVSDFAAIGVMGAIRDAGLRVGKDVAVVGYNDLDVAAQLPVPLTSVRSPLFDMGSQSMHTLLNLVNGRKVRSRRLVPSLVPRASTLDYLALA